jgi:Dolichyl-phosphate-mannose-protein mannosyltransferase
MTGRAVSGAIIAAFSIAVGHLAWHALLGRPMVPDYMIGGDVTALSGWDAHAKQLYLRRLLYLTQRPRHSWLQVVGRDELRVFVNGSLIAEQTQDGFPVAVVVDPAPYLRIGTNVIAIVARQSSTRHPPVVAVDGAYTLGGNEHPLRSDDNLWRCSTVFERRAYWWFSPDFIDRHWPYARLTTCSLRGKVDKPPRATRVACAGHWITPAAQRDGSAGVRREFEVAGRPRQAWMRVTATSSYRLALNGIVFDEQEDQLSTTTPVPPVQRTYDITLLVRRGSNVLALILTSTAGPPHLLIDLEVEERSGYRSRFSTDEQWMSRPGLPSDWLQPSLDDPSRWRPCHLESGDLDIPPWHPRREANTISLPLPIAIQDAAEQVGLIVMVALLMLLACRSASHLLLAWLRGSGRSDPARIVYLALVPATLAIAGAVLATYDPRVARQDVYRGAWVAWAAASVPLQWGLLALAVRSRKQDGPPDLPRMGRVARTWAVGWLVSMLVAVGFWLRVRDIAIDSLHYDELTVLRASLGLLDRGFPSFKISNNLPIYYVAGCELECCGPALAALVFGKDYSIIRLPSVCWGTLTILLIYTTGRRLFGVPTGLIAAAIYTLSPSCIRMSNFGRYPSLLQFLTLLTVHFFSLTIRGTGPIDRRALWLTTLGFIAMFLSWEASALIAPGMALAALVQRREHLRPMLCDPSVWMAMLVVIAVVALQFAHAYLQQAQFLVYGTGWSDVKLTPMWLYPFFNLWRYAWLASWSWYAFVPMLGVMGAGLLTIRHGLRQPARLLMLIFLSNCMMQALLLPIMTARYSYHLIPLVILLSSATIGAIARSLARLARQPGMPALWQVYAQSISVLLPATIIALGNGNTIHLTEMSRFLVPVWLGQTHVFQIINMRGPVEYLREHIQKGDVVIAIHPDVVDHYMALTDGRPLDPTRSSDFWLQSKLYFPAVLDEPQSLSVHRFYGTEVIVHRFYRTEVIPSLESLEELFARATRIWYILQPIHSLQNESEVSFFLRQHMEIVYEDYSSTVLFRGNHRLASQRLQDDKALNNAHANFLP